MKKKNDFLFGFTIMLIMAIFTMVGCELPEDEDATFPLGFRGTWVRNYTSEWTNTLTFTSDTLKDSTQSYYWELKSVSGNNYTIKASTAEYSPTINIRIEKGNLRIGHDSASGEHDWDGEWRKR